SLVLDLKLCYGLDGAAGDVVAQVLRAARAAGAAVSCAACGADVARGLRAVAEGGGFDVEFFATLDGALDAAEDALLRRRGVDGGAGPPAKGLPDSPPPARDAAGFARALALVAARHPAVDVEPLAALRA
ncbi:hypothetical protein AURANDRAFT_69563, partial [Aureococcus anophagefferens]